jgi:hypothetical protein
MRSTMDRYQERQQRRQQLMRLTTRELLARLNAYKPDHEATTRWTKGRLALAILEIELPYR